MVLSFCQIQGHKKWHNNLCFLPSVGTVTLPTVNNEKEHANRLLPSVTRTSLPFHVPTISDRLLSYFIVTGSGSILWWQSSA